MIIIKIFNNGPICSASAQPMDIIVRVCITVCRVDTAAKIADAIGCTLDYLVKDSEYKNIDNDALKRLKLIEKLPKEERSHLFALMDAFFAQHKLQSLLK